MILSKVFSLESVMKNSMTRWQIVFKYERLSDISLLKSSSKSSSVWLALGNLEGAVKFDLIRRLERIR